MSREIKKVTIVGAGTMGAGIAAQLANAGIQSYLLDIVPKNGTDRNAYAKGAIDRLRKADVRKDPMSAGLMLASNADLITPGNQEDDLERAVKDSDLVIEVIIEDLNIKRTLFARIDQYRRPGTIVTSNTSTIPLQELIEGRSEDFRKNFAITHFFNPPRFMSLLELISGKETAPEVTKTLADFCDVKMGKNVVHCNDTPGFIANRIGTYFMYRTMAETIDRKLKIEDVDAVLARPMGFPKTGVFGLIDLVGVQLIPHLIGSLQRTLPADDAFRKIDGKPSMGIIETLLKDGRTGNKSDKGGFYNRAKAEDGSRVTKSLNLQTGEYEVADRKKKHAAVSAGKKGMRAVFETKDNLGGFAWAVMRDTLVYSLSLVPQISDDISAIDAAMRDGYSWDKGPFEMLDAIGHEWFIKKLEQEGIPVPPVLTIAGGKPFYTEMGGKIRHAKFDFASNSFTYEQPAERPGVINLADIKRTSKPLLEHNSARLWDIGDGVVCFEFTSKANTLDPSVMYVLNESIKLVNGSNGKYKAMVIYSDEKNFSLGANLAYIDMKFKMAQAPFSSIANMVVPAKASTKLRSATQKVGACLDRAYHATIGKSRMEKTYQMVEDLLFQGQSVYKALRDAPFPVVGAPAGFAFGGGCEILLHCDAVQAHAELNMGLVEAGVGVIPGWGGCTRMLERVQKAQQDGKIANGPLFGVRKAFELMAMPAEAISLSAQDARKKLWLRDQDGITMNRTRLLTDAKEKALALVPGYEPPRPNRHRLPGPAAVASFNSKLDDFYVQGLANYHDVVVTDALAHILSGGHTHIGKELNDSKIAQLEREAFMSLVRTKETQARVSYMVANNKPLREGPLNPPKSLDDIRAARKPLTLKWRELTGKPMDGKDAKRLKEMADDTARFYKIARKLGMV